MSDRVTPKQERFLLELLRGRSQRAAYRVAYNAENMAPHVIDVKASELLRNGKVRVRYDELLEERRAEVGWDRAIATGSLLEVLEIARGVLESKDVPAPAAARLASWCIAELNRLHGVVDTPGGHELVVIVDNIPRPESG